MSRIVKMLGPYHDEDLLMRRIFIDLLEPDCLLDSKLIGSVNALTIHIREINLNNIYQSPLDHKSV
jgi:hypothetical protein